MSYFIFASTYGSGQYDSSTYSGSTAEATSSSVSQNPASTAAPGGSGLLANTGFDVLLALSLACLIIFVALIIRFWKRPPTKSNQV